MSALEIQQLYEYDGDDFSGSPLGFYTKGQHDPKVFIKELESEFDYTCQPSAVEHGHFRLVPCDGVMIWRDSKPGAGAFVATYVEHDAVRFITDECLMCDKPHSDLEACAGPAAPEASQLPTD